MTNTNKKPRILFPYVEAGMGHITPMRSFVSVFKKKYGDKVDIVEVSFFQDSGSAKLKELEELFTKNVRWTNRNPILGRLGSRLLLNPIMGPRFPNWVTCKKLVKNSYKDAIKHMESLKPDLVFSTHYSTHYYAMQLKENRPITVSYCPDSYLHNYYRYPADYVLTITEKSYKKDAKKRSVIKVPFFIRNEAFEITQSKQELRKEFGLPEDKFTIVLSEGGYGIGKMQKICEGLLQMDLPINLVPVCGRNEKLFEYFKTLKPKYDSVTFNPIGFNTKMLQTIAMADLYIGKSAHASIAEPTFFGVPSIASGCATSVEKDSAHHFCKTVGSTLKITKVSKIINKIVEFVNKPELLEVYKQKAIADRPNYGAEKAADWLWQLIEKSFIK